MRWGGLLTRLSAILRKSFPERQIYIRCAGSVQFFTFGPSLQAWLAGLAMILMAWVGFATVCVIFKDRSIAALDDRYEQTRAAYAGRLSDLQASYNDLGAALAQSAQRFHLAVGRLAEKQKLVGELFAQDSRVEGIAGAPDAASTGVEGQPYGDNLTPAYTLTTSRPLADQDDDLGRHPKPYLAINWAGVYALTGALASRVRLAVSHLVSNGGLRRQTSRVQNPALIVLERQGERVRLLDASETLLLRQAEGVFDQHTERLHGVIRRTGIDPNQFMEKVASADAVGGPEISLDQVQILGIADPGFTHAYLLAQAVLDRLATLSSAMRHIPLDMPVSAARFDRTSGFGPRRDPFTGRYAFHPGLDFGGPWGAPVVATAPGIVVFAGDDGSYGTTVEIDHGMGFHTRYAHLSALAVRKGMTVKKDTVIGRVGSTGRSTGPHVHYEIWYDNRVRNPALFLSNGGHGFSGSSGSSAEGVSATARDND